MFLEDLSHKCGKLCPKLESKKKHLGIRGQLVVYKSFLKQKKLESSNSKKILSGRYFLDHDKLTGALC